MKRDLKLLHFVLIVLSYHINPTVLKLALSHGRGAKPCLIYCRSKHINPVRLIYNSVGVPYYVNQSSTKFLLYRWGSAYTLKLRLGITKCSLSYVITTVYFYKHYLILSTLSNKINNIIIYIKVLVFQLKHQYGYVQGCLLVVTI